MIKSLHRQPGGKTVQRPWILANFPEDHRRYVEPFAGAATVLLYKPRSPEEFLVEADYWQATLLRVVRDDVKALVEALRPYGYNRETFNLALHKLNCDEWAGDVELAALTWALKRTSRGGELREYSENPGRNAGLWWSNGLAKLDHISERFQGVQILHGDAFDWIPFLDHKSTFFYMDPPYHPLTRAKIRLFRHELSREDHIRLIGMILTLSGRVCLSGYDHPDYQDLDDWDIERRPYHLAAHWDRQMFRRRKKTEVLWKNY
jgi:DNA adenine methylase